jgi:acetolactate decarboxylase
LYEPVITVGQARAHGNFGVGQYAELDGELTAVDGVFFHARSDGSVKVATDDDQLCFAQLCFFDPTIEEQITGPQDESAFQSFFQSKMLFPNDFWAFHITGRFTEIVPTAPPALTKPYPPFAEAVRPEKPSQPAI